MDKQLRITIERLKSLALQRKDLPSAVRYVAVFDRALNGDAAAIDEVTRDLDSGVFSEVLTDNDFGCLWT